MNWWKIASIVQSVVIVAALLFASWFVIVNWGIQLDTVEGISMEPTLHDMDKILVNCYSMIYRNPKRGDIVVIWRPENKDGKYDIKRIAGVPGDPLRTVAGGKHYLLGKDQYFVVGDNLEHSEDSREYGPINVKQIIGVVIQ